MRNLDSLHHYLHKFGKNDEERVFMFYGYFAIHCRYDYSRKGNKKVTEYTPYYTVKVRSGVCRDFSSLFKELCKRSNIPCLEVFGRTPDNLKNTLIDILRMKTKHSNHAWNIVKYNNTWHHMDPTWSTIVRTEKYYSENQYGSIDYVSKVKIPERRYYDCSTELMFNKRASTHPAFYLSQVVPTYNSALKATKHHRIWQISYNFETVLDSLVAHPLYEISSEFRSIGKKYCHNFNYGRLLSDHWEFLKLKRTPYNPLTMEKCDSHLEEFKKILVYLKYEGNHGLFRRFEIHEQEVKKFQDRLKRRLNS